MSWQPVNLAASEFDAPPDPPTTAGLLYLGKRHLLSGRPNRRRRSSPGHTRTSMSKTAKRRDRRLRDGAPRDPAATLDLGFTLDQICAHVAYYEPDGPPTEADIPALVDANTTLVIVDAAAGAYDASGLDDNKRADVEKFTRVDSAAPPARRHHARHRPRHEERRDTRALLDRLERKLGGADGHLGLEVIGQPLSRGGNALVKVHVH